MVYFAQMNSCTAANPLEKIISIECPCHGTCDTSRHGRRVWPPDDGIAIFWAATAWVKLRRILLMTAECNRTNRSGASPVLTSLSNHSGG